MQFVKQIFFIATNCTFIKYSDECHKLGMENLIITLKRHHSGC